MSGESYPDHAAERAAKKFGKLYGRSAVWTTLCPPGTPEDGPVDFTKWRHDRLGFCRDVLGVTLTPDQIAMTLDMPGRIKIESGHSVGKSWWMACMILHWHYCIVPSVVICSAPKLEHLEDVLWSEIRLLHARSKVPLPDHFVGPKAPEMYVSPDHLAKGFTTSKGEAYHGRHRENMLFAFDEDEGIEPVFWDGTESMYQPDRGHAWISSCNPLSNASQSYRESMAKARAGGPKWKLYRLSALDHPNITAELEHRPPPIPAAVSLQQVDQWLMDWADRVPDGDHRPGDLQWPPHSGLYYRPGPVFMGRVLGQRPTEGVNTVWGMTAWEEACRAKFTPRYAWENYWGIQIGCDVAVYGDDSSVIHVRTGGLSLHHERHNGWLPKRLSDRIKELCVVWSAWYNAQATIPTRPRLESKDVKVVIELDGPGVGVLEFGRGYGKWSGIKVAEASEVMDSVGRPQYYLKRSELWFEGRKKAMQGKLDLSRLPRQVLDRLQEQLLTAAYKLRTDGSLQVEEKAEIKKRLKRSPDDADGFLVSLTEARTYAPEVLGKSEDADPRGR